MEIPKHPDITYFAETYYRDTKQQFGIKRRDRRQHMYILGKSGTGKSTMLSNMMIQDVARGEGLCVVDPHGELVESLLAMIPEHRMDDVIYFNPSDTDFHMGFNVLEIVDPKYKHLVASGLMGIFTKMWANVWSSRMEYILNNCILALLDTPGSTLLGVPRLLVDKQYRKEIVGNITDPVVKAFWIQEYEAWQEKFRNEAIAPIQNKVGQFLSTAIVRNIIGQQKSTIDVYDIMNSKKIFLVNLSKGRIGEDNSSLLGGMIITKIQLAAMERVRIKEEERQDFYLYVDEFQNFVTDSFASILSEARKYRLNLIIAHQYVDQLVVEGSATVRDAVFGNVGSMIVFRVGARDAEFLEQEFEPEFIPQDFVMLPNYHTYLKLMVDGMTTRPFSAKTLPPFTLTSAQNAPERIIEASRRLYHRPRAEVEEEINAWSERQGSSDNNNQSNNKKEISGNSSSETSDKPMHEKACDVCSKKAFLPFEPTPGLPIYCKDCLQKVRKGEIAPVIKKKALEQTKKESPQKPKKDLPNPQTQQKKETTKTVPILDKESQKNLKDALAEALQKETQKEQPKKQEETKYNNRNSKPIPLQSLQNNQAPIVSTKKVHEKGPTQESVSLFQKALSSFSQESEKETINKENPQDKKYPKNIPTNTIAPIPSRNSEEKPVQSTTKTQPNPTMSRTPKELPEDILRKVLE
jgi:CxxC-x17-CxxC domain-containing protein